MLNQTQFALSALCKQRNGYNITNNDTTNWVNATEYVAFMGCTNDC